MNITRMAVTGIAPRLASYTNSTPFTDISSRGIILQINTQCACLISISEYYAYSSNGKIDMVNDCRCAWSTVYELN